MKNRLLTLGLLVCSFAVSAAAAPNESLDEKILWSPDAPEHALFIPQAVLARTPIEALPLPDYTRSDLAERVDSVREATARPVLKDRPINEVVDQIAAETIAKVGAVTEEQREGIRRMVERSVRRSREIDERYRPGCNFKGAAAAGPPQGPIDRLADVADRSAMAFTARVTAVVTGWSAIEGREATMVYLDVEEVFLDRAGFLWPGKLVAFDQTYGDIEIGGVRLCTVPETTDTRAEVGDRFLVFGAQAAIDSTFVSRAETYPIVDGRIVPQPDFPGRTVEPTRIAAFREQQLALDCKKSGLGNEGRSVALLADARQMDRTRGDLEHVPQPRRSARSRL